MRRPWRPTERAECGRGQPQTAAFHEGLRGYAQRLVVDVMRENADRVQGTRAARGAVQTGHGVEPKGAC